MSIINIDPATLADMLTQTPDLQLVDVRTPEEFWFLGHIPQAQLIPLHELPYQFRVLDATQPVVVTCQHGVRSLDASYFLEAQGFDQIFNLQDGMASWPGPVERDTRKLEEQLLPQDNA